MFMTEIEYALITCLKAFGIDYETTAGIVSILETEPNMIKMLEWMLEEHDKGNLPTEQQILRKLKEIVTQN